MAQFEYNSTLWMDGHKSVTLTKYIGNEKVVEIPAEIEGMPVFGLGRYLFDMCTDIEVVKIPASVYFISDDIWGSCKPLCVEVDPGNERYEVKWDMLMAKDRSELVWCAPSKQGTLRISLNVKQINPGAFMKCVQLEEIEVPESCREIGDYAFMDCTALKKVKLPQRSVTLGVGAFWGCKNLTEIRLPEDCSKLSAYLFAGTGITRIEIPEDAKVDKSCFRFCEDDAGVEREVEVVRKKMDRIDGNTKKFYCLMMMTTTKKGVGRESRFRGKGDVMAYELKLVCGCDEADLLRKCLEQRDTWLRTHPDYEALGLSEAWIEAKDEYTLEVLNEGTEEEYLLDVLMERVYKASKDRSICCEITTFDCYAEGFWQLKYELYHQGAHLPSTPGDFDSNAIEGADAWEMLHGELMDEANYWNRYNWIIRGHIDLDREGEAGLAAMNAELYRIAHEPKLGVNELRYFESVH